MTTKTTKTAPKKVAKTEQSVEAMNGDANTLEEFLDHQRKAFNEAGRALESLLPTAFREHGQAAVQEVIEGYRNLFNSIIDTIVSTIEKAKMESGKGMDELAETVEKVKISKAEEKAPEA